jgi:hypothetical protein
MGIVWTAINLAIVVTSLFYQFRDFTLGIPFCQLLFKDNNNLEISMAGKGSARRGGAPSQKLSPSPFKERGQGVRFGT